MSAFSRRRPATRLRAYALLLLVAAGLPAKAQSAYLPTGHLTEHLIDRLEITGGDLRGQLQTATKPYRREDVVRYALRGDSLGLWTSRADRFNRRYLYRDNAEFAAQAADSLWERSARDWWGVFYREPASFLQVDEPAFDLRINPVFHGEIGGQSAGGDFRYLNTRGAELRGRVDRRVAFYLFASENQGRFMDHVQDRWRAQDQVMPGEGRAKSTNDDTLFFGGGGLDFFSARGYVDVALTRHVSATFGQDRRFIGDGVRSLILGDDGKDMLFLQLKTRVWKIDYQNLFAELADYGPANIKDGPIPKKYLALHRLGINVGRNANVGVFEAVVFGPVDSTGRSGFEFHYLNPLIFYRAIEFNLGSLDNVLIGADWKVNFLRHGQFYGQFVLDELNISKLREDRGWWANKVGFQAGLKYVNAFGVPNLDLQGEFNTVRPYTYGHFERVSNYAHFSQPLAHPLGANFREAIGVVRWQPIGPVSLHARVIAARYGTDPDGATNWGGDVFKDNDGFEREFGNTVGQGLRNDLVMLDATVSWQVFHDVFADLRLIHRRNASDDPALDATNTFAGLGVRWNAVARDYGY